MKSLLLRRRLVTAEVGKPYDAEVEYLESDGNQAIDTTEHYTRSTTKVYLRYMKFSNKKYAFGANSSDNKTSVLFCNGGSNGTTYSFRLWRYKNLYSTDSDTWQTNAEIHELEITKSFKVDGVGRWTPGVNDTDFTSERTLFLFASHNANNAFGSSSMRVYACKIWQNDVLVRDFIPVRKGQVGYMFDKVSGELFGNLGTVDFILGPDV